MYNILVFLDDDLLDEYSTYSVDYDTIIAEINTKFGQDTWNRLEIEE